MCVCVFFVQLWVCCCVISFARVPEHDDKCVCVCVFDNFESHNIPFLVVERFFVIFCCDLSVTNNLDWFRFLFVYYILRGFV